MSAPAGYPMLEIQIFSINVLGLTGSFLKWSLFKWDQQLEKIWNLSVSTDESVVKDIIWLKKTLSWIVAARHIIDRVLFLAYLANISTLLIRKWQDLLIFWMMLSFLKDIVLEVIVISTTFLLWYENSVPTSLLIEFVAEKTMWLGLSMYKWCTTLKWYMQLRRAAKFRKFTIIARRSIASIVPVLGKISHSLEDICLDISIARRSIYSDLRISKSLTTLINNDSRDTSDTNDNDSIANDLSVAEKSMRILSITAEDVMDARARILERSFWNEQDATAKTSETMEEVVAEHSLEKEMDASMINESTATAYAKDIMDHTLRKEDIIRFPLIAKELKTNGDKAVLNARKKDILTKKQKEQIPLIKIKKIILDKGGSYTEASPSDSYTATKIKDEESKKFAKIMQRSSRKDVRDIKVKSCASLVKLKARLELAEKCCCIPISPEEDGIDQIDERRYLCRDKTKLMSTDSSENNKECCKIWKTSSCHHEKNVRSIDINNKIINHDVEKRKFLPFIPDIISNIDAQKDKFHEHGFPFRYYKHRLMKQIQEFEASLERSRELVTWRSMSLAQTARPSGYERNAIANNKSCICQKHVQNEAFDDSYDFLMMRHITQMQSGRSSNLRSVYNVTSFKTNNYTEHEKIIQLQTLKTFNDQTLFENKRDAKTCKKHNFSENRISIKDRKAIELKALKAYNKLTLLKDKKELEKKKRDLSLINQQSMKRPEASEMKFLKLCNDLALLENGKKMETNCKGSSEDASSLRIYNELREFSHNEEDRRELEIGRKYNEISAKYEENIETPMSISDHFSEANHEETTISSARQITNSNFDMNDCDARRVHMSLNLWEITRNIEWTLHPTFRGIILTNKNLHSQFLKNDRLRESQQRDIVDNNTASALHGVFFHKSEITRIFRLAQIRISESSFPNLSTFWRIEDFNTEFVCRVHNEMAMQYQDSLLDFNLERLMASHNDFGSTSLSDSINGNRISSQENNRDLCMSFIDREQLENESDTAITEDSVTESWEDASSSARDVHTTSATNDNLSLQLIVNVLRNLGAEVSEGSIHVASSVEHLEEHGNVSNRILDEDLETNKHTTDNIHFNEDNNNKYKILSNQNANIDNTLDDSNEVLNMSNNRSDNKDVSVNLSDIPHKPQDKKYLNDKNVSDTHFEKKMYGNDISHENIDNNVTLQLPDYNNNNNNDLECGTLINATEKSSCLLQNSSQLSLSRPSLLESANYRASSSNGEEFQKLTQLLGNETILENQEKSKLMLNTANGNTVSRFQSVETLQLKTIEQDNVKNNDGANDVYDMSTGFTTNQFSKMNSSEKLQQDDSFHSRYDRENSNSETPVSLEEGSLMEEFSNDTMLSRTASNASVRISA